VSSIPADLRYTESHEYLKPTGDPSVVIVGITDFAQGELGDVVYLDLPKSGASYGAHDSFGTIEAVKAVSDMYCPVAGEVVAVNPRLEGEPSLVNSDPYGEGWMIKLKVKPADVSALMDAAAYEAHVAAGGGAH
jgi:glycine cleavage system H protein